MIFEKNNKIIKYIEKPKKKVKTDLANASIYLLTNDFLYYMKKNFSKSKDFAKDILPYTFNFFTLYKHRGYLIDIGTPIDLKYAKKLKIKI